MSEGVKTWQDHLGSASYNALFDAAFFNRWGKQPWMPVKADADAAANLHTELNSRILIQELRYRDGVAKSALASVHSLFGSARTIVGKHPGCVHFEETVWHVLNRHVRPFTAKWHGLSEAGAFDALDGTDEFRAELRDLQSLLVKLDQLMLELRSNRPSVVLAQDVGVAVTDAPIAEETDAAMTDVPIAEETDVTMRDVPIAEEMRHSLPWRILDTPRIKGRVPVDDINRAERARIEERRKRVKIKQSPDHAAGLALSGGGIRSAAFSLGVLGALARHNVLRHVDYLSTVSGGGYLGSFLTAFATSPSPQVPPISLSKGDEPLGNGSESGDTEAVRHIRQNCRYLLNGSSWNRAVIAVMQAGSVLINMMLLVGLVSFVSTFMFLPKLLQPQDISTINDVAVLWNLSSVALLAVWLVYSKNRELGLLLGAAALPLMVFTGKGFFPMEWLLEGLFWIFLILAIVVPWRAKRCEWLRDRTTLIISVPVAIIVAVLTVEGLDLLNTMDTTKATDTVTAASSAKPWHLLILAALLTVAAPTLLVASGRQQSRRLQQVVTVLASLSVPLFLLGCEMLIYGQMSDFLGLSRVVAVLILAFFALRIVNVNETSLHRFYRDKLAGTFLIRRSAEAGKPFEQGVKVRLGDIPGDSPMPYHLLNAALNLPNSRAPEMSGRLTDHFLFSPAYCGSPILGYRKTNDWQLCNPDLDLATAMAVSGAAVSPQMGLGTSGYRRFWLALLNIRLGYWLQRPADGEGAGKPMIPTLHCLLQEMFGLMKETDRHVCVSDGGHIENLGVYELLRRRCKYIVAVDGEHDPDMTFHALTNLQRMARIDLNTDIQVDLSDLRLTDNGFSRSHFAFCRIVYPQAKPEAEAEAKTQCYGYLLYVKLSLTGNEGEFIRRYKFDEPDFPHHSTAEQFFTEAQFEAYRFLGEHIGETLFAPAIITSRPLDKKKELEDWFCRIGESMLTPRREGREGGTA